MVDMISGAQTWGYKRDSTTLRTQSCRAYRGPHRRSQPCPLLLGVCASSVRIPEARGRHGGVVP